MVVDTGSDPSFSTSRASYFFILNINIIVPRFFRYIFIAIAKIFAIIANDNLEFCHALAKAYIELNEYPKFNKLKKVIADRDGQNIHDKVIGHPSG